MDANNRLIPIVDDDQGEGFRDPITSQELVELYSSLLRESHKKLEKFDLIGHLLKKQEQEK